MANTATGNALLGVKPIYRGELRENHDCFWNQIDQICTDNIMGNIDNWKMMWSWPLSKEFTGPIRYDLRFARKCMTNVGGI